MVEALKRALDTDPSATSVRAHLVRVLLEGDEPERAWLACEPLLLSQPDDPAVLALAADAAERSGRPAQAQSYRRLSGLVNDPAPAPVNEPSAAPVEAASVSAPENLGDEADAFLRDVLREHEQQHVTLSDVGGLTDVKKRIELSFLSPLRNPDLRMAYGKSLRGGLLLWGPPGCGKTFLARAIAGEMGAPFISVGIHEVLDMWLGNSERNLHNIFENARRIQPAVVFFDEIDAIGFSRTNQRSAATRNLVATLLTELDGIGNDNNSVFVLAATNQPWDVDPALRRPGRFDRTLLVLPPDIEARRAIFETHLRNRPTANIDLNQLARKTDGYSGSDLRLICESATERAFEDATRQGRLEPISQSHLEAALQEITPSLGPWLDSAKNFVAYANETGDYDELASYLRRRPRR